MNKRLIVIFLFLVFVFTACANQGGSFVEINNKKIELVGVAGDDQSSYLGLSFREEICENCGMLFTFGEKTEKTFVMRDMLFSLDIIWIDEDTIVKIDKNLEPEGSDFKNFYESGQPVNYVLEVNAGFVDKNNIKVGDKVKYSLTTL